MQIDDGWEREVGDWLPNAKFPAGMGALAERITDAGMVAGPVARAVHRAAATPTSPANAPSCCCAIRAGQPVVAGYNWGTGYWALDLTRADAREHVAALIHTRRARLGLPLPEARLHQRRGAAPVRPDGADREQLTGTRCALIREVAGDDVYLLGSGAMLLPSLGLLDGLRSGPDVAPMWQNYATDDPSDAMARNAVVNSRPPALAVTPGRGRP